MTSAHSRPTQDNLTKLEQTLTQQRATLAADEYQKRVQEIRQKAAELQRDAQERENKLEVAFRNAGVKVENAMTQIVDEINKERNFTITIRRFAVIGEHEPSRHHAGRAQAAQSAYAERRRRVAQVEADVSKAPRAEPLDSSKFRRGGARNGRR